VLNKTEVTKRARATDLTLSRISHFAFDDKYTTTNLRVITIEKRQYANYTCKAFNVLVRAVTRQLTRKKMV
jgi:hypothetical protein